MLRVLNEGEMDGIHELSLQILEKVGVRMTHRRALDLLKSGGCVVDESKSRVRIPRNLSEEIIKKSTGRELKLYYRDRKRCVKMGEDVFFSLGPLQFQDLLTGTVNDYVFDLERLERRYATKEDVAKAGILADSLENVKILGVPLVPHDPPAKTRGLHALAILAQNASKPIAWIHVIDLEMARIAVEVEKILAGGMEELRKRPRHTALLEAISPLSYDDRVVNLLFFYSELGLPAFSIGSMPQPGVTAPMSIPAAIAQNVAEILPGLYLTELANPDLVPAPAWCLGVCVKHCWALDVMLSDPRNLRHLYAAPETALVGLAESQFFREYYGVPVWGTRALRTDAKMPGIQAAIEKALTATLAVLAGATTLGPAGQVDSDQIFCFEQLVIDNEIAELLKRLKRGIPTEKIDFELQIVERGLEKGNYLSDPLTLRRNREMVYIPKLLDRQRYEQWAKAGKEDVLPRAKREVERILKDLQPSPQVDQATARQIEKLLADADRRIAGK
ncbi:MAG: trimethylamine methyltransferase family protein [Candidatus Brockarchaeota archaeon]|nr:trimethylamine methyltransferase family protein [Candidatus Brockarchaeota archaeon]